ncbi:alkaline phosphatase [Sulfuricella denitrificans skB26]|uniref:Alkaline phosphatase n=1 Tax=Sulfuricella denitrificans (strain DSM 22764 / NBRC 105220 / skB26) TaxID=1163617 RepID=S6ANX4_SULDS|nr:alkaline phosphatase [Sulfuricella denitrificans]BAN36604.1 alkaline phosphatase [Sulfuricella denitrificans skB26]
MHHSVRKLVAAAVATTFTLSGVAPAFAAEPVVQGPESVSDWWNAGQAFVADSKKLHANRHHAKNVILFVGDGMGISTVTASRILEGQMKGATGEENRLFFETLPYVALSKTYSWDQQTSDSAPTMTAMVTGYKTREGMLSVDHTTARGECDAAVVAAKSLPTILEQAAAAGKATGIVSTARITHATPAATYAHTPVRDWESDANLPAGCGVKDIARQLIEASPAVKSSLKVVLGGGRDYFRMNTQLDPEYTTKKGLRKDGRDLTAEWVSTRNVIASGAQYVWDKAGFEAANPASTPFLLGLFERSHAQYEADRATDTAGEPSLTEMTAKSIEMLKKSKRGFFLHVEGGRIDHAHHAGNAKRAMLDTIEFAKAVKMAYDMTDPEETLIIVTADHSHTFTIAGYPHRGNNILGLVKEVPSVDGNAPVNSVDKLGLPYTTLGYANGPGWRDAVATGQKRPDLSAEDTNALGFLQESAVPLGSETHAGEDVPVYASGPDAYLVHGSMEQNWIYHVMKEAFQLHDKKD